MKYLAIITALALSACASTSQLEDHVHTALDATKAAVDPAYGAAMEGCVIREQAIESAMEQGFKPAYEAQAELAQVHERCEKTRRAFEDVRAAYNEAVRLYKAGKFAEAFAEYAKVTKAWSAMNGGAK
jgi:hypothetical protein